MSPFLFQWPAMLWLLLLVPVAAWLLRRARRLRGELTSRMGGVPAIPRVRRDLLRLSALGLLVVALARPGYAPERQSISQSGRDVVFAIDVSRSMLARDAQPSRLEAAKQGVRDALEILRTERAGLVIYAGSATILCPLTHDYDFVRYMLDQAAPRAVDFGGTTLLSAVEKSADNLFSDERAGMQDLVVLTDGQDHGPEMGRVAMLLQERGVDLLLVGLGDASSEARIPVDDGEGGEKYLQHEGDFVLTRLNDEALRDLSSQVSGASYVAPGVEPFDLAGIYAGHIDGKPVAGAVDSETFVVYREAAWPLMVVALVLLLGGGWFRGRVALWFLVCFVSWAGVPLQAGEDRLKESFAKAREFQVEGKLDDALAIYGELDARAGVLGASSAQLAAVQFNQALCYLARARVFAPDSPENALAAAQQAQRCFLDAKRMDPEMDRAGRRLDGTAALITTYREQVEEREKEDEETQKLMNDLLARLKALRDAEGVLMEDVQAREPRTGRSSSSRRGALRPAAQAPPPTAAEARGFVGRQEALLAEGRAIRDSMEALDQALSPSAGEGETATGSIMAEPMRLMTVAIDAQVEAGRHLADPAHWGAARTRLQVVRDRIEEIIDLLAGDNEGEPDEGDGEEFGDDWEVEDYNDGEDGTPSSMMMEGDLAAGSEMQPLPVPNYSAEDLLMEEKGNAQFRQQERAKAQAGKVEKDW